MFCVLLELLSLLTLSLIFEIFNSGSLHKSLPFGNFLRIFNENQVVLFFLILTVLLAISRFVLLRTQTNFAYKVIIDMSSDIVDQIIHSSVSKVIKYNIKALVADIHNKSTYLAHYGILSILSILSSVIITVSVMSFLIYTNALVSIFLGLALTGYYCAVQILISRPVKKNSIIISETEPLLQKNMVETFQNIRSLKIDDLTSDSKNVLKTQITSFRKATASTHIISSSPRILLELIVMLVVVTLAFTSLNDPTDKVNWDQSGLLTILYGLIRILPHVQSIFQSYTNLRTYSGSFIEIERLLGDTKSSDYKNITKPTDYKSNSTGRHHKINKLSISNHVVSLDTSQGQNKKLFFPNIDVKRGDLLLIKGASGAGKTTMIESLLGFSSQESARICVNDSNICSKLSHYFETISYQSQFTFVFNDTLRKNIDPKNQYINEDIYSAMRRVNLYEEIKVLENGLETIIGDGGLLLSGGQLQRLSLLRIQLKNPSLAIFDEPTNGLDAINCNLFIKCFVTSLEAQQNRITFIVTHSDIFDRYATQIIKLDKC